MIDNINNKINLAVVGLGKRGQGLLDTLLEMDDIKITALCEVYEDRLQEGIKKVKNETELQPDGYRDYNKLFKRDDLEGVIIATNWATHIEIAIAAMKAGIYPASEVGGVNSLKECWDLIETYESTETEFMLLENCCYGRRELAVLNMVKKGLFGELIHCQCGYLHDLREEIVMGEENRHYRLQNYLHRNGDLYPTHGVGPVSKFLDINRGNRFLNLTSMASKARGLKKWAKNNLGEDHKLANKDYPKGDIVTTMIKCAGGETVLIVHDTSLPRPYSRNLKVQGTKGLCMEDNNSIYIENKSEPHTWESFDDYREEYEHPLWQEFLEKGVQGGHGGMDYLVLRAYIHSLKNDIPAPVNVYDAATWMAVTPLSEKSVAKGGITVDFPDFTKGKWMNEDVFNQSKYSLETINPDLFDFNE